MPFVNPFGYTSVPAAVLADRLGDLAPLGGDARVFFTSGGSEAVETALKLAKQYQTLSGFPHRWKTISRRVAYHGTTMGALSVNGLTDARSAFGPLVPGARHAPMSHRYRCPYCKDAPACTLMCYDEIERLVEFEGPDQVAAIITRAGPERRRLHPARLDGLLQEDPQALRRDRHPDDHGRGHLRIRPPRRRSSPPTYYGVEPDVITTAKGITSSYAPLGAVMVRKAVADAFAEPAAEGLPSPVAAPQARLPPRPDLRRAPGLLRRGASPTWTSCSRRICPARREQTGAYLRDELESTLGNHPNVGDIRGAGLFLGVELVADQETKETFRDNGTARLADRPDAGARPDPAQRQPQRPDHPALPAAGHHPGGMRPDRIGARRDDYGTGTPARDGRHESALGRELREYR